MATKGFQAQGPTMTAAAERDSGGGGGGRAPTGSLPPPRRGQIKEKIIKDAVAAVASLAASLVRTDKNADGNK